MPKSNPLSRKRKRVPRTVADQNEPDPYTDDDINGAVYGNQGVKMLRSILFWEYAREVASLRMIVERFRVETRDQLSKVQKGKFGPLRPPKEPSSEINLVYPFQLKFLIKDLAFPDKPFWKSETYEKIQKNGKSIANFQRVADWPNSGWRRSAPAGSQGVGVKSLILDFYEDKPQCIAYKGQGQITFCAPGIPVEFPVGCSEGQRVTHLLIACGETLEQTMDLREIDQYVISEDERYLEEPLIIQKGALVACPGTIDKNTGLLNLNFTLFPDKYSDGSDLSGVYKIFVLSWTSAVLNARSGALNLNLKYGSSEFPVLPRTKADLERDIRSLFALRLSRNATKDWLPSSIRYHQNTKPLSPYLASPKQITNEGENAISAAKKLFPNASDLMATSKKVRMRSPLSKMPITYLDT